MNKVPDPFKEAREKGPILVADTDGETIPMILGLKNVRAAARDWKTYSSDAPRRVPIPSEEDVRTVRQYPLEVDPPEHTQYRKLVEPFFLRPKLPEVREKINALIARLLDEAIAAKSIDLVRDFAIPLQSHALTYLLNVDEKEAETWIGWGIHVFKEGDGESKGSFMENYSQKMFEAAADNPGDDFFSTLNEAELNGRKLTMEEKLGYANIAFAGGRDTIIHTVTNILAYLAGNPKALTCLREHPESINTAAEEFFRYYIPLTHIGRVCPHATNVHGHEVAAGDRISLCWSAANRDPDVFENPDEVQIDRKPNPHIAFGFGIHACLGAHHARAIMRELLGQVSKKVASIEILKEVHLVEKEKDFSRKVGFENLIARVSAR
ncbi:MAG: cytochrome P450 [Puniceicoccaceae bacterium]